MNPSPLKITGAQDMGVLFARNAHRMIGQDGAFSIPLDAGRTLWFFGDTLIGRRTGRSLWYIDGKPVGSADMSGRGGIDRMINNTGLILNHRTGADALDDFQYICDGDGQLRALIPLQGDEHPDRDRIWCQHGCAFGDEVVLSFIKVRMLEHGPLPVNFEIVGSGLATGRKDQWRFSRVQRDNSSILWSADQPHFATAFLRVPNDRFVYLYGTVNCAGVQSCHLARVPQDQITEIGKYEYLANCGPGWSRNVADATTLFTGMPSELSFSFNSHLQSYLAVHSLDLTGKIVGRTAPHPWGPWSEPVVLWTVKVQHERPLPYPTLIYAGKEHPELAGDGGKRLYLTYVEFEEYFPHLIEITLA